MDAQPCPPQDDDQRAQAPPVATTARCTHDGDDFLDGRRVRRIAQPLVAWRATGVEPRHGRRRPTSTGTIEQVLGHDPSSARIGSQGSTQPAPGQPAQRRRPGHRAVRGKQKPSRPAYRIVALLALVRSGRARYGGMAIGRCLGGSVTMWGTVRRRAGPSRGHASSRTRSSARLPSASNARAAVGVRDLQRHMRRAVSVMLAMRTVLPTSLSSRSLSACHSTTQSAPA